MHTDGETVWFDGGSSLIGSVGVQHLLPAASCVLEKICALYELGYWLDSGDGPVYYFSHRRDSRPGLARADLAEAVVVAYDGIMEVGE